MSYTHTQNASKWRACTHLQAVDDLLHLVALEVEVALDEVAVDEADARLGLALGVERTPEVVVNLANALDHLRQLVLHVLQEREEILRHLCHHA